jgi:hypothetical protein
MPILIAGTLVVSLTGVLISNLTAMDPPPAPKVREKRETTARRTPPAPLPPSPPLSLCACVACE